MNMRVSRFWTAVWSVVLVIGAAAPAAVVAEPGTVGPIVSDAVHSDVSPPLRNVVSAPSAATRTNRPLRRFNVGAGSGPDTALQTSVSSSLAVTSPNGFDGIGNGVHGYTVAWAPPDTVGAVGATQYVQMVNTDIAVFDKTTGAIVSGFPKPANSVWAGFGGACETNNDGDPIVEYDKMANRWVVSQFSVNTKPYMECVAVSATSDATGSYYRYAFSYGSRDFPDYPKLSVWPDAYYISYNIFNAFFRGAMLCALDRAAMLVGAAATQQCFQLSSTYHSLLPASLDGASSALGPGGSARPPAGTPGLFVNLGSNALRVWKFRANWANPALTTLSGPASISVAGFATACNGGGTCIPQPDTTQKLASLGDRLMYRLAYRHFPDGHEALVVNHSVSVSGVTSVRWYELRNATGSTMAASTPVLHQQGTLSAADGLHRWMGSIAQDGAGNIALGYSGSSGSVYPSIRATGRLASDAAGTMQAETVLKAGSGSQLPNLARWGDYSSMSADPVDDCTFYYTTEYLKTSGTWNWNTWVASFKFESCESSGGTGPTTGTLAGTVTDAATSAPITGATVAVEGGPSTATDSTGAYSISGLAPATYSVTASASGFLDSTQSAEIIAGLTSTVNFALTASGGGGGGGGPTVPGTLDAPAVSPGPGKGVSVSWAAPSDDGGSAITGYTLSRYLDCTGAANATFNLGTQLSYKDTSTTRGSTYCYAVAARNAIGTGPESALSAPVTPNK